MHLERLKQHIQCIRQEQDNRIFRRLLNGLQKCILRLHGHLLSFIYNINFIFAAVRFDHNIVVDLFTDIIYTNTVGLLMRNPLYIRVIAAVKLMACPAHIT